MVRRVNSCGSFWFSSSSLHGDPGWRGYYDFSQKFATQWKRRFRLHKVYMISITRRVDLTHVRLSICSI